MWRYEKSILKEKKNETIINIQNRIDKMVRIVTVKHGSKTIKIDTIYKRLKKDATNKKEFVRKFKGFRTSPSKSSRLANIYFR